MCAKCDTLEADLQTEVLFAGIERELMLAEADAGESIPGAIRPLSAAERRAKMRFSEIEALEQSAADEAAKLLASNAQVYIIAIIGAIFGEADAVQPAAVVEAIETLNRVQPDDVVAETAAAQKNMSAILRDVYAGSSKVVIGEAKRQGVKKTPKPLTAAPDRFDLLAKAVALAPWTRLTSKLQADMMNPATLMKTALAEGDPIKRADVEKALNDIPLDGSVDLARQTIHTAHGAGRIEAAETMAPEEIYASELLDGETCDACARVDGKDYDSVAEAKTEYETGGYGACKGGARCRGTLVFQYNALGTDAPDAVAPPQPVPVLQDPEPKPAPKPVDPAATPWGRAVVEAKKQLPKDLKKLGYREELPDLKKLIAEERAIRIEAAGADLPELKRRAAEIKDRMKEIEDLRAAIGFYPPSKWPADVLPIARKLGISRKSPKNVGDFLTDAWQELWDLDLEASGAVYRLERQLERVEEYVKKWHMPDKPLKVDDVLPDGNLGKGTAKALDAVLDAGAALDDELQQRVVKRVKDLGEDPNIAYKRNHEEVRRLVILRGETPDDELFKKLGKQIDDLYAEAAKYHEPMQAYDRAKTAIMREEVLALLGDVRAVGGGKRSIYTKGATWSQDVADAMGFAHTLYPDDWNDMIAEKFPTVELAEVSRGYNAGGKEITLSRDKHHKGSGDFGHVAVHELGHSMELAIPGLANLEWAFHYYRSDKIKRVDGTVELKPPIEIYAGSREMGYEDKWAADYTGKSYRRSDQVGAEAQWEIFQTGIESLFEGSRYFTRTGSLGDDAEFRRFILGVLSVL